jgi:F0F1-type ATP synthase assembly protein I
MCFCSICYDAFIPVALFMMLICEFSIHDAFHEICFYGADLHDDILDAFFLIQIFAVFKSEDNNFYGRNIVRISVDDGKR